MNKIYLALLLLASALFADAQPLLQWAKNIGGSRGDEIKTDAAGNVYTVGYFSGVADFDPGAGTFYLTADGGGADDAYVSKLDVNGNFVWAARLGGDATNYNFSIEVDAAGNVYSVGYFSGTVDFDPGPGVFNLTTNGQSDISISKLDAAGNFIWGKRIGGTLGEFAYAMLLDQSGNLCITGIFNGIVDFDPGPLVFNLDGNGANECYILKLDADGNFIWAKEIDGFYAQGDDIAKDASGNLYVCGVYSQTVDLDPGAGVYNVTSSGSADAFVIKLDATGNFIWGRSFGGPGSQTCESVKADAAGNIYLTGFFPLTADFNPGAGVFEMTALGSSDAFVSKLDAAGNFIWAKAFSGTAADNANDLAVDALGNVFITGVFQTTADFDPGPGVYNLTVTGGVSNDIYIAKLDAAGNFGWAINYGGTTLDAGLSIFTSAAGNIYATGFFEGVVDFDPGPGIITSLNSSTGRTFIVNLGSGALPLTLIEFSGKNVEGGNELIWKTTQEINTSHFELQWSSTGHQFNNLATLPAAGNNSQAQQYNYVHGRPVSGNNFYRLKMADIDGRFTYSPIIVVNINTSSSPSLKIFPNPVTDILQLYIQSEKKESVVCNLYTAEGKIITSGKIELVKGSNLLTWNMQYLTPGNYFLSAIGTRFETIKIIKK